jgi:hypothetical protein
LARGAKLSGSTLGLQDEPPLSLRIAERFRPENLDRHRPPETGVERAIDDPHAALGNFLEDAEVGESLSNHSVGRRICLLLTRSNPFGRATPEKRLPVS